MLQCFPAGACVNYELDPNGHTSTSLSTLYMPLVGSIEKNKGMLRSMIILTDFVLSLVISLLAKLLQLRCPFGDVCRVSQKCFCMTC